MKSPLNAIHLISFVCLAQGLNAAEKTNVFFVHGANVSEREAHVWASEMFKRLWQSGANMEFCPVAWESDIGPDYNYHVNASNAFVTARRLAPLVNGASGRKVVIAHSLGTMVVAAAIQDYGLQVDKFIMLNSAIPSEAFEPSLADYSSLFMRTGRIIRPNAGWRDGMSSSQRIRMTRAAN